MRIILASQSPRRKELLEKMGVVFETMPSDYDEQLDDNRSPEAVAEELALGKALVIAEKYPEALVIGSDTIVTIDGEQLGKAQDLAEARTMLQKLAGKKHVVTTSLALVRLADDVRYTGSENTDVYFKPFDEAAVQNYLDGGNILDKAGGYGIQSGAAPLIDHIEGNFDTVVGLPTHLLAEVFGRFGIAARPVDLPSPVPQIKR